MKQPNWLRIPGKRSAGFCSGLHKRAQCLIRKTLLANTWAVIIVLLVTVCSLISDVRSAEYLARGHDFVKLTKSKDMTFSCLVCHIEEPGSSEMQLRYGQNLNYEPATFNYEGYTTIHGNQSNLDGHSKLCMGCHDGITALDCGNHEKSPLSRAGLIDPSRSHPVGLKFPPRAASGKLLKDFYRFPLGKVRVFGTDQKRIECSSCHNPHGGSRSQMLREPLQGSKLCRQCHNR